MILEELFETKVGVGISRELFKIDKLYLLIKLIRRRPLEFIIGILSRLVSEQSFPKRALRSPKIKQGEREKLPMSLDKQVNKKRNQNYKNDI